MTITERQTELYELFCSNPDSRTPVPALTKVRTVYMGEPRPGDALGPLWLTVSAFKGSPTELEFNVRVYGDPRSDALQIQRDMVEMVQVVWNILELEPQFVVPGFETHSLQEIDLLVASFKVTAGRGDLH